MSNVKIILVGDAVEGLKYATLGVHYAKKARRDGLTHGQSMNNIVGNVHFRVNLDDYTGDKCYIEAAGSCPRIQYSGFVDTYPSDDSYTFGKSLRKEELQNKAEQRVDMMLPLGIMDYSLQKPIPGDGLPPGYYALPSESKMYGVRRIDGPTKLPAPLPPYPAPTPAQRRNFDQQSSYTVSVHGKDYVKQLVAPPQSEQYFRKFFRAHTPSRYTGLMRKALQATFATDGWVGALTFQTTPEAPRQFRLGNTWGNSYGLVLAPGKDGSSGAHYFLIRITYGEVHWVPASLCVHKVKVGTATVFTPVIKSVNNAGAKSLGLLSYAGTSMFETVGWSFSYTKPKASVVLYDYRGPLSAPELFTHVATVEINFGEKTGVPESVSLTEEPPKRLWHGLVKSSGAVQLLAYDIAGNIALNSLYNEIRGGPAPTDKNIDAPVGAFYRQDGGLEVVRFTFTRTEAETKTYTTFYGEPVGANDGYSYSSIYGGGWPYSIIANNIDEYMANGTGSVVRSGYDTHVIKTSGVTTPEQTAAVTDGRTLEAPYKDAYHIDTAASSSWNSAPQLVSLGGNQYDVYLYRSSLCTVSTGSNYSLPMSCTSAVAPVDGDAECFVVAYTGTSGYTSSARTYGWVQRYKYKSGGEAPVLRAGSIYYPQLGLGYWPGLVQASSCNIYSMNPPGGEAPDGYYYGGFLAGSSGAPSYPIPPDAKLPLGSYTESGSHIGELAYVTSSGTFRFGPTEDPAMIMQVIRFHDPREENDSYIPVFSQSAFSTADKKRYSRTDNTTNQRVVVIDGTEYNAENAVTGWIGVV